MPTTLYSLPTHKEVIQSLALLSYEDINQALKMPDNIDLTVMFPIDNLSSSLKVPLLVVCVFPPLAVAATGRRTGSRIMPHKTRMPNTSREHEE